MRRPRTLRSCLGLILAALLSGCGGDSGQPRIHAAEGDYRPPELVAFVYDRSGSMSDYQLELSSELTTGRLLHLRHGDRIAALGMLQRSLAEPPERWTQQVPEREYPDRKVLQDSVTRARFIRDARDYLKKFTATEDRGGITGTDVLSTLHDVAAVIRAYPKHDPVVYIFSDMLQSTPGIEMEGLTKMPGQSWIRRARENGKLPDLGGACVVVVGARTDTNVGQRVKQFWDAYFDATNAKLLDSNYMLRPVRLPVAPCEGASDTAGTDAAAGEVNGR